VLRRGNKGTPRGATTAQRQSGAKTGATPAGDFCRPGIADTIPR